MSSLVSYGTDWQLLTDAGRPNGLVIGSDLAINGLLGSLRMSLVPPVFRWPIHGVPWCGAAPFSTLILYPVDALRLDQQKRLLAWMAEAGSDVQVISAALAPLFPLVQRGHFLEALYYRLNVVYLEAD